MARKPTRAASPPHTSWQIERGGVHLKKEFEQITRSAREGITKVVGIGPLVLFSTATRDAWVLDVEDKLACCLARDGASLGVDFEESDERFSIRWQAGFEIHGEAFVLLEDGPRVRTILGYPTEAIASTIKLLHDRGQR